MFFLALLSVAFAVSDPNCDSAFCSQCVVNMPSVCASCIDDYVLRGETCISKHEIHCLKTVNNICTQCEDGYEWDSIEHECVPGENGCQYLGEDGMSCIQCKKGWMINDDYTCSECFANPYCKEFDGSCDKCVDCGNSYALIDGVCQNLVEHCSLYDGNKCLDCALGYYLYKQECRRGPIENCQKYELNDLTDSYDCKQCIETFLYDRATQTCVFEKDYITEGCEKMLNKTQCLYCRKNYHMTLKGTCTPCPEGCLSCNIHDECEECDEGYELVDNVCQEKKVKNPYNCLPKATGLITKDLCEQANVNCVFEEVNGEAYCTYKSLNCTKHDQNSRCEECALGYVLDEENQVGCKSPIEGCIKYATKENDGQTTVKCVSCDSNGYYIKEDFTCGKCDETCSDGKCSYKNTYCETYRCADYGCAKCSKNRETCDVCYHGVAVGNDGWCGADICADYLENGECNYCAHYSLEQVYDVVLKQNVPKNYYFYVPDENGNCGEFVPPEDPDHKPVDPNDPNADEDDEDGGNSVDGELVMYIILGIVGIIIIVGLLAGLVVLIVWLVKKRMNRNSEYHILD